MNTFKNKKLFFILLFYALSSNLLLIYNSSLYFDFLLIFWLIFFSFNYFQKSLNQNLKYIYPTIILALILFIFSYLLGFKIGFIHNPYNLNSINSIKNIVAQILSIFGLETIRYKLIPNCKNKYFIALITLLIIGNEIKFMPLFTLKNTKLFNYIFSTIIPLFAENILFTYFALNQNILIPLIIKILDKIILFFPIIPYYNWFIKGSFTILKTLLIYFIFKYFIFPKRKIKRHKNSMPILIYALTLLMATLLISFMLGLFSYEPIAILSNSMSPLFTRGDLVIYQKTDTFSNKDIIVYQNNSQIIVHRIISCNEDFYVTKGDANNTADKIKVKKNAIKGIYKFHIKYLGYPAIWLKEILNKEVLK